MKLLPETVEENRKASWLRFHRKSQCSAVSMFGSRCVLSEGHLWWHSETGTPDSQWHKTGDGLIQREATHAR